MVRDAAGEEYPVEPVALGDQKMRRPGTCEQDFVIELATGEVTKHCAGINRLRRDVLRKPRLEGPDVLVILRDQGAFGGLIGHAIPKCWSTSWDVERKWTRNRSITRASPCSRMPRQFGLSLPQ